MEPLAPALMRNSRTFLGLSLLDKQREAVS